MLMAIDVFFYVRAGYSLTVDRSGIRQQLYGMTLRAIPWDVVMDTLCFPIVENGGLRNINILIRLKGCRGTPPNGGTYGGVYGTALYRIAHPIKTIYIDFDNYTSEIGQYTELTYCWK